MLLADYFGKGLTQRAQRDDRIWVLDGDLADSDGAHHFARQHPERFVMAGIAEQSMVSIAAGMATTGARPFVFSFAAFLCCRAYDQIRIGLCQAAQPVALVASHAGGLSGRNGKSHTIVNDFALLSTLPAIRLFAPADPSDVDFTLRTLLTCDAASYTRLPRRQVEAADHLPGEAQLCRWVTPRRELAVVSCGVATLWTLEALAWYGLAEHVGVIHCLEIADSAELRSALLGVQRAVVVEDHHAVGGLTSLMRGVAASQFVGAVSWPHSFTGCSGADSEVRNAYGMGAEQIANKVRSYLARGIG